MLGAVSLVGAGACSDVSGSSTSVLSLQFDSLPFPAVVVGDTLRDTTGAVVRPVVHAFDFKGAEITPAPVYFLSPDSGVTVDSATGIVVGDSLRSTPARIIATVGTLQAIQKVSLTLSPFLAQAVNGVDTLKYSLFDSTLNVSHALTVKLTHGIAPNDSAVNSWLVSFAIVSQSDPRLGELVNIAGKPSVVATTDASGVGNSDSSASCLPDLDHWRFDRGQGNGEVQGSAGEWKSGAARSNPEAAGLRPVMIGGRKWR